MQTVIIASGNKGKLKEFQELMKDLPVEVRSLADYPEIGDIEENGATFADNAYIKAKAVYDATGSLAIADDSGLEVDALGGAPGIYSARYAGEEKDDAKNNAKLLAALEDVPEGGERCFRCYRLRMEEAARLDTVLSFHEEDKVFCIQFLDVCNSIQRHSECQIR